MDFISLQILKVIEELVDSYDTIVSGSDLLGKILNQKDNCFDIISLILSQNDSNFEEYKKIVNWFYQVFFSSLKRNTIFQEKARISLLYRKHKDQISLLKKSETEAQERCLLSPSVRKLECLKGEIFQLSKNIAGRNKFFEEYPKKLEKLEQDFNEKISNTSEEEETQKITKEYNTSLSSLEIKKKNSEDLVMKLKSDLKEKEETLNSLEQKTIEYQELQSIKKQYLEFIESVGIKKHEEILQTLGKSIGASSAISGHSFEDKVAIFFSEVVKLVNNCQEKGEDTEQPSIEILRNVTLGANCGEFDLLIVSVPPNARYHGEVSIKKNVKSMHRVKPLKNSNVGILSQGEETNDRNESSSGDDFVTVLFAVECKKDLNEIGKSTEVLHSLLNWLQGPSDSYSPKEWKTNSFPTGHFDRSAFQQVSNDSDIIYKFTSSSFRLFGSDSKQYNKRILYFSTLRDNQELTLPKCDRGPLEIRLVEALPFPTLEYEELASMRKDSSLEFLEKNNYFKDSEEQTKKFQKLMEWVKKHFSSSKMTPIQLFELYSGYENHILFFLNKKTDCRNEEK